MVCQLLVELTEVMKRMPVMRIRLNSVLGLQRFPCEKHKSIGEVLSGLGTPAIGLSTDIALVASERSSHSPWFTLVWLVPVKENVRQHPCPELHVSVNHICSPAARPRLVKPTESILGESIWLWGLDPRVPCSLLCLQTAWHALYWDKHMYVHVCVHFNFFLESWQFRPLQHVSNGMQHSRSS